MLRLHLKQYPRRGQSAEQPTYGTSSSSSATTALVSLEGMPSSPGVFFGDDYDDQNQGLMDDEDQDGEPMEEEEYDTTTATTVVDWPTKEDQEKEDSTTDHHHHKRPKLEEVYEEASTDQSVLSSTSWSMISSCPPPATSTKIDPEYLDNEDGDDIDRDSVASSISGFDLISLNGSSQIQCPRCTFLNHKSTTTTTYCQMCDSPLQELVVKAEEEEDEDGDLLAGVSKRYEKAAHSLASDIVSVVDNCHLGPTTRQHIILSTLAHEQLTKLAASFLECLLDNGGQQCGISSCTKQVQLCYCFTSMEPNTLQQIYQKGFGNNVLFGSTPDAAAHAYKRPRRFIPHYYRSRRFQRRYCYHNNSNTMETIRESDNPSGEPPTGCVGWIAAVICGDESMAKDDYHIKVRSGSARVYSVQRCDSTARALPLVSFPANIIERDIVRRLLNGLTKTFSNHNTNGTEPNAAAAAATTTFWGPLIPKEEEQEITTTTSPNNNNKEKTPTTRNPMSGSSPCANKLRRNHPPQDSNTKKKMTSAVLFGSAE